MLKFLYLLKKFLYLLILAIYLQRKLLFNFPFKAEENVFCIFKSALIFSYIIFYAISSCHCRMFCTHCKFAFATNCFYFVVQFVFLCLAIFVASKFLQTHPTSFPWSSNVVFSYLPTASLPNTSAIFFVYLCLKFNEIVVSYFNIWCYQLFPEVPSKFESCQITVYWFAKNRYSICTYLKWILMNILSSSLILYEQTILKKSNRQYLHLLLCDHVKQSRQVFFSCLALPKPFCA